MSSNNIKSNKEIVLEFEARVFDIYPFRGTDRYEYDLYIPKAKNWLKNILDLKDQAHKAEVEEVKLRAFKDCKDIMLLASSFGQAFEDVEEKIALLTTPLPESDEQK